jgi:hypothetical protein
VKPRETKGKFPMEFRKRELTDHQELGQRTILFPRRETKGQAKAKVRLGLIL